jgi:two-component SAPR family response regulator
MKALRTFIIITISSLVLVAVIIYFSKSVNSETENRIKTSLNSQLHIFPKDLKNFDIKKQFPFSGQFYLVKFDSSESEINSWIKRNEKIQKSYSLVAGVSNYIYMPKGYFLHVITRKNKVEIKVHEF